MRVGIDARSVYAGHGGIGTYARELVRALARVDQENRYFVLCTERKGPAPIAAAANVTEIRCPAAMLDRRWEQLQLPTLAEDLGLDVLHMTCFGTPVVKPCRVISTIHDVVFRERPDLVAPWLAAYLDRSAAFSAREADWVITVSEHSRQAIGRAYRMPPDRISVIYLAASGGFRPRDRQEAAKRVKKRFGLEGGYVLSVGALEPKKNIDGLLDAFSRLVRDGFPRQVLVVAGGEGGMAYDLGRALRLRRLGGSVRVLGHVPDVDLPSLYTAAGAFVCLSFYEGFGLPPLEAMACGTPTIVSSATSLPEVAGKGALLVDPDEPLEIANTIAKLLTDTALAHELSQRGVERASTFSWEETARQTLQVYATVAGATGAGQCGC